MNVPAGTAGFPYDLYRAIGDDRYVTPGELPPESGDAGRALWEVYDRHFGRFTGAGLDPGFARFARPDVPFGLPRFSAGSPVVIAGGGPGLDAAAADLAAVRSRVLVVTDPAGAAALQRHALAPDLVLVERQPGGREDAPLAEALQLGPRTALLIEPSAPIAAFERGAGLRRLARDLPSWGVWPATAVAVALRGGATRLITIGLDGTTDADERARTDALLSALAQYSAADCLEVGPQSGRASWWPVSWPNVVPIDAPGNATLSWHELGGASLLRAEAERDLLFLAPLLPHARETLTLARRARPDIFVIIRQNHMQDRALVAAARANLEFVQSDIMVHECLQVLKTPMLGRFIAQLREGDGATASATLERVRQEVGEGAPRAWKFECDVLQPGMFFAFFQRGGAPVTIGHLVADPTFPTERLRASALMIERDSVRTLLPDDNKVVRPGDRILFVGDDTARRLQQRYLTEPGTVAWVCSGSEPPRGLIFRWWHKRRARNES